MIKKFIFYLSWEISVRDGATQEKILQQAMGHAYGQAVGTDDVSGNYW